MSLYLDIERQIKAIDRWMPKGAAKKAAWESREPENLLRFGLSFGLPLDPWQCELLEYAGKRVLLNCHRQSGKSTISSILALHELEYKPNSLTILISPSLRQSIELFRKVMAHRENIKKPIGLVEDTASSCTAENGARIVSLPSSEATVRGFSSVSLLIEDEASRVTDDLYKAVRPMLAVSQGNLILMSTPFGRRGHFYEEWTNGGPVWHRVKFPASKSTRIDKAFLEEEKHSMGNWWYMQEYECEFLDSIDQVFAYEDVMDAVSDRIEPMFPIAGGW